MLGEAIPNIFNRVFHIFIVVLRHGEYGVSIILTMGLKRT